MPTEIKLLSEISFQAKLAGATQRQTESYLKPLLRKLKHKVLQTETAKLLFLWNLHTSNIIITDNYKLCLYK